MQDAHPASNSANIAYDDLREWLEIAERMGEVRHIEGATWQEDIGLVAEAILRAEYGPCVVFDNVPGCPKGFRLLLNVFAGKRRNMTLGLPDHLTKWELSDAYREAYLKHPRILRHEIVETGPVLENIITGDAIDVTIVSGAGLAREGRRPLHRHRHLHHHARSGRGLAQRRRLSRAGARQGDRRLPDRQGPPWLDASPEVLGQGRADARRDGARRRPRRVLLRRHRSPLRHLRARYRRRHARPTCQDDQGPIHGTALSGQRGDRARRLLPPGQDAHRGPVRRVDGPLRGRRRRRCRCSTSRQSIIATIRSCTAFRRWAPAPTRCPATAR